MTIPNVLTIAGSDPSGGAGIQADLKTMSALGVYAMSVVTALTAQNTRGVTAVHLPPADFVRAQLDAVFDDVRVDAVKIGMIANAEIASTVAEALEHLAPRHVVLDPVMVAKGGDRLLEPEAVEVVRTRLLPLATVITPNLPEADVLLGAMPDLGHAPAARDVNHVMRPGMRQPLVERLTAMAARLRGLGAKAVYLKGGQRLATDARGGGLDPNAAIEDCDSALPPPAIDFFDDGVSQLVLRSPLHRTRALHGTGCTLSSALAALLAREVPLAEAAEMAKLWVADAIVGGALLTVGSGGGFGPVHHFHALWMHADDQARTRLTPRS